MKKLIIFILLLFAFTSCKYYNLSTKKDVRVATKKYNQAKERSDFTVARLAREDFPCVKGNPDTVQKTDTFVKEKIVPQLVEVDCPDTTKTLEGKDTIIKKKALVYANCNCKDSMIQNSLVITIPVKDSAEAKIFAHTLDSVKAHYDNLLLETNKNFIKKDKAVTGWRTSTLVLGGIILILITLLIVALAKKIKL